MSTTKSLSLTCLIVCISLHWAAVAVASQAPEAFIAQNVHEFKPVVEGTSIEHEFAIQNRGNAPLEIIDLQSG